MPDTQQPATETEEPSRWMVWYSDDELEPVGVLAPDRKTAATIGRNARPNATPVAIVGEDEGAADDLAQFSDDDLSTETDPTRFLTALHDTPEPLY